MDNTIVNKAKLIYYMNSHDRKYYEESYIVHLNSMIKLLDVFKVNDPVLESGVWLYNARCPKSNLIKEFGDRTFNMVTDTSLQYQLSKRNRDAVILLLCDRIAHLDYFLENGRKGGYNALHKHHNLFHRELYVNGQCDQIWAYLNMLMEKDWNNLMCI